MEKRQEKLKEKIDVLTVLKDQLKVLQGKKKSLKKKATIVLPKTIDSCSRKIEQTKTMVKKMEMELKLKDDTKEIALGTSKINYMDPRISISWCKSNEIPIEKVFAKTLRSKFLWAMYCEPTWTF